MKILLFSDLHAHAFKTYSTILPNGRNSRLQDALNILDEIRSIADEEIVDGILFGGDLFHIRPSLGTMKIPTFNAVIDAVSRMRMGRYFVGLLVGNHDQGDKAGNEHSLYAFGSVVTVMDRRRWYTFGGPDVGYVNVFAIPASSEHGNIGQDVEQAVKHGTDKLEPGNKLLLGHLGVDGAVVGSNYRLRDSNLCTCGDLHSNAFDWVFLGDYHLPQKLSANIHYIGATHQHNWGDAGQGRRCLIWDTKSGVVVSKPLTAAPKFVRVEFDLWDSIADDEIQDNFIRITYTNPITPAVQEQIRDHMLDRQARTVEFYQLESTKPTVEPTAEFNPSMDYAAMVQAYVQSEMPEDLDDDLLLNMGQELFARALEKVEG